MGDATESDRLVKRHLELLESGNFADAEIICDGRVWKVHKLILRSGCVWFDKAFANNWTEAQTGRIHVREHQPERVDDLLKFIYSGRFTPEVESKDADTLNPSLEANVSLWQTADYFLLSSLKTEVYVYLLDRIATILFGFHEANICESNIKLRPYTEDSVTIFIADSFKAIKTAYICPAARNIQKLFAIFACGLREYIPGPTLWDLMKIAGFQKDVSTALIAINFTQATKARVVKPLTSSCDSATNTYQCAQCGTDISRDICRKFIVVLDPFSQGRQKWCEGCEFNSIKASLKTLISEWPAELE